jgi:type I restriction enzyme, S subunit
MIKHELEKYDVYKVSEISWLNHVPSHWVGQRVKELSVTISKGTTPSTEGFVFTDDGVRFIKAENIVNKKSVLKHPAYYISEEANLALARSNLRSNDLLIVIAGATIGKVGIVSEDLLPANTNQAVCFVRFRKNLNIGFLYYLFVSSYFSNYIWYRVVQSAQPNLSMGVLGNFILFMPPIVEQKDITDYLDIKTEQIDRRMGLLTKKAALYRKLKQSLINETVTCGLDKNVVMKDSGVKWIGDIPKHWGVKHFKQISTMKGRIGWQGLKNSEFIDEGPFLITGMNFKDGRINWNEVYHISNERYEQAPEIQLRQNDILMTKDGTIGKLLYVENIPSPHMASLNSHLLVLRPIKNSYYPKYLYYQLDSSMFKNYIDIVKTGTTFFGISQAAVGRYIAIVPPISEQKAIADYLDQKTAHIDKIITNLHTQIEKLKELRKTLINDVVTGKIKVFERRFGGGNTA